MATALSTPAMRLQATEPAWELCTGGESVSDGTYNYFTAWYEIPACGDRPLLRVYVARLIVPLAVARSISDQAELTWKRFAH